MRKVASIILVFAFIVSIPSLGHARGEGWKDVLWGSLYGCAFGTILGGVSLIAYPSQQESDAHIYNVAIGAGAGLAAGATYGAIIGWPKNEILEQVQLIFIPSIGEESETTFIGFRKYF